MNQEDIEITLSSIFLKNGKIWSSDILINEMSTEYGDNFLHISDFEVSSIEEEKDYINLISNDGNQIQIENSKLFLASGVLTSSVLLSKSLNTSFFEIRDSKLIAMPLLKIGKKPTTPRKKLEIPKSPEQLIKKHGRLANQGELVIKSMLMIQESILDSDALQGYEALPEQITRIMYEVFGIMALNEEFTTPEEILDVWMESYIDGWVELELEN